MGNTVTFKGAPGGVTRVRDGDLVFRKDRPVDDVPAEVVDRLKSLEDHEFEVGSKAATKKEEKNG
jgi:hypothetical protein